MLKTIASRSALAVALIALTVPATRLHASGPTTPTVVTGGDPQPTGEVMTPILLTMPSLVIL